MMTTPAPPAPERLSLAAGLLRDHPAQMRTVYDQEALATLTLQVATRGLDEWQPLLVAPAQPGDHEEGELYNLLSGHRRYRALLLAWYLRDEQLIPIDDTPLEIEVVRSAIQSLVDEAGGLDEAIAVLGERYATDEVPCVRFHGSRLEEILALQRANFGHEKPDMLGLAISFKAAIEAGATPAQIAATIGQPVGYVTNHLALAKVPREIAALVAAKQLPFGVATALAEIPQLDRRHGLAALVLQQPPEQVPAGKVGEVAKALGKWPTLQMPLTPKHQAQRNLARMVVRLWGNAVAAYPIQSWSALAGLMWQGVNTSAPWEEPQAVEAWVRYLSGDHYLTEANTLDWGKLISELLDEISCSTCPLATLPAETVADDLPGHPTAVLGMACRYGGGVAKCIHGLAPGDPFHVRAPSTWADLPGATTEGTTVAFLSLETLHEAWEAQRDREAAEADAAVAEAERAARAAEDAEADAAADSAPTPSTATATGDQRTLRSRPTLATAHPDKPYPSTSGTSGGDKLPSPIQKMREQIADFMARHEEKGYDRDHPYATPCTRCQHLRSDSPTKDPSVPHCAWAARLRPVAFSQIRIEGKATAIPVCHQFAPKVSWREIIPAHPTDTGYSREWLLATIRYLAERAVITDSLRGLCQFLTGRPLSATESHQTWFKAQLEAQVGELADGQLATLLVWVLSESERLRHSALSGRAFIAPQATYAPATEKAF